MPYCVLPDCRCAEVQKIATHFHFGDETCVTDRRLGAGHADPNSDLTFPGTEVGDLSNAAPFPCRRQLSAIPASLIGPDGGLLFVSSTASTTDHDSWAAQPYFPLKKSISIRAPHRLPTCDMRAVAS